MPAIKTLKLLAHGDSYGTSSSSKQPPYSLTRVSSLNTQKNLTQTKSLRTVSSRLNNEQSNDRKINHSENVNNDSEQPQTGTEDGDS
jgi:hypothetical protein